MAKSANKYYIDNNGNEVFIGEVNADNCIEGETNVIYRCSGKDENEKPCGIPVNLHPKRYIDRDGKIKKTKYFSEAFHNNQHIPGCDQYEKGKRITRINMLIKEGASEFSFDLFSSRMSKEGKERRGGHGPDGGPKTPGGGHGTNGDDDDNYKDVEIKDVLPKNINELGEVFDELGSEGEYGKKKVYEMYLSPDTIEHYSKGVWNTVLVKANKSIYLYNARRENLKDNGYYHLILRGEQNTFDFVLIPRNEKIGNKIYALITKYSMDPEKQILVLGNWRKYKDCYNVFCCEINNMNQIKAVRN